MAENNEIPENADKILFAEDFVKCMMWIKARIEHPESSLEEFRGIIHNAFNKDTEGALYYLVNEMEMSHHEICVSMKRDNPVLSSEIYIRFAEEKGDQYLTEGFEAQNFLLYCVHVVYVALFFNNNGVSEAISLAVSLIVNALEYFDMLNGGWDALDVVAANYANMAYYSVNLLARVVQDSDYYESMEDDIASNGDSLLPNQNKVDKSDDDVDNNSSKGEENSLEMTGENRLQNLKKRSFSEKEYPNNSKKSCKSPSEKKRKTSD